MIKRLIKCKSKQTYMNKEGKEKHYYNYFLELQNGKRIQIKASFIKDNAILDTICDYVG